VELFVRFFVVINGRLFVALFVSINRETLVDTVFVSLSKLGESSGLLTNNAIISLPFITAIYTARPKNVAPRTLQRVYGTDLQFYSHALLPKNHAAGAASMYRLIIDTGK
jgi:hypothetical protein